MSNNHLTLSVKIVMKSMWLLVFTALVTLASSQSLPQFQIREVNLTNNSYIVFSNISREYDALKCVTDNVNCCNDSDAGNWRDEGGRVVHQGADRATCLYVTRGQGVVSLNRRRSCTPGTSGLWRCDIPDSSEVMQNIYIYIDNESYGKYCHYRCNMVSNDDDDDD